jgi:hypothetical protein
VAESGQITLVNGAAIPEKEALDGPGWLERPMLPIIGSESIDMKIDRILLNRENEKQLALWNTTGACVCLLNENATLIERRVVLEFTDVVSENILKCQWLPSSENFLSVGFGKGVGVYSIHP